MSVRAVVAACVENVVERITLGQVGANDLTLDVSNDLTLDVSRILCDMVCF